MQPIGAGLHEAAAGDLVGGARLSCGPALFACGLSGSALARPGGGGPSEFLPAPVVGVVRAARAVASRAAGAAFTVASNVPFFATKAGISKVGSYTGNGSNQTINCGFTTGARFILIKRTDFTGNWFVWDSVRGIVAGNDPHLSLNTTAAEVTTDDSIDPDTSGFIVNQDAATNINVNAATYIYLSLA